MADKLGIGSTFPRMTLGLVKGGTIDLPSGLGGRYGVVLFYRGPWCPYCRRQLQGFEALRSEFDKIGANIFAASVDTPERVQEVQAEVSFPIGHGVSRDTQRLLGAWWEERRNFMQPAEFVLDNETRKILFASYSDGPFGRFVGSEILAGIQRVELRKSEGAPLPA